MDLYHYKRFQISRSLGKKEATHQVPNKCWMESLRSFCKCREMTRGGIVTSISDGTPQVEALNHVKARPEMKLDFELTFGDLVDGRYLKRSERDFPLPVANSRSSWRPGHPRKHSSSQHLNTTNSNLK